MSGGFGAVQLVSLAAGSPVVSSKHCTVRVSVALAPQLGAQPAHPVSCQLKQCGTAHASLSIGLLGASQLASPTRARVWSSRHHTVRVRKPAGPHAGPQLCHGSETLKQRKKEKQTGNRQGVSSVRCTALAGLSWAELG